MERKISRNKYLIAFIITIVVFSLGFFLSLLLESGRSNYTSKIIEQEKIDTSSLQLQYLYLNEMDIDNCNSLNEIFKINLRSLDKSMKRVGSYGDSSIIDKDEFNLIQREYVLEQVKYWLLAHKVKERCQKNFVTALSFFNKNCDDCATQTFILEFMKKQLGEDFLLFHFDAELNEPMVSTLIAQYNITEFPTTIIESKKFTGLTTKEKLLDETCKLYTEKPEVCN